MFGDRCIFVHALQFHWHDYSQGEMDVDRDAKNQIMDLADRLHEFSCQTKDREMELWGWMQDMLRTPEAHQLVSQVELSMQDATAQFAQEMYQYVGDEVAKMADELATLGTYLQDIQKNKVSKVQLQDLVTGNQVQVVDERVMQLDAAHHSYVDQAVMTARTLLQAKINGKIVMIKAGFQ